MNHKPCNGSRMCAIGVTLPSGETFAAYVAPTRALGAAVEIGEACNARRVTLVIPTTGERWTYDRPIGAACETCAGDGASSLTRDDDRAARYTCERHAWIPFAAAVQS